MYIFKNKCNVDKSDSSLAIGGLSTFSTSVVRRRSSLQILFSLFELSWFPQYFHNMFCMSMVTNFLSFPSVVLHKVLLILTKPAQV